MFTIRGQSIPCFTLSVATSRAILFIKLALVTTKCQVSCRGLYFLQESFFILISSQRLTGVQVFLIHIMAFDIYILERFTSMSLRFNCFDWYILIDVSFRSETPIKGQTHVQKNLESRYPELILINERKINFHFHVISLK